jgi:hypothetical protein
MFRGIRENGRGRFARTERGRLLVGNQGGFPRAVGAEEVAGTVGKLGGAVGFLARAATGARRPAAESL